MPPGAVTQTFPALSHFMPSGTPGSSSERMPEAKIRSAPSDPSGSDVEDANQRARRIVDVELSLVGRKAETIRLLEEISIDEELRLAAALSARGKRPGSRADAVARHRRLASVRTRGPKNRSSHPSARRRHSGCSVPCPRNARRESRACHCAHAPGSTWRARRSPKRDPRHRSCRCTCSKAASTSRTPVRSS